MEPLPPYVDERRSLRRRQLARGLVCALTLAVLAVWVLRGASVADADVGRVARQSNPAAVASPPSNPPAGQARAAPVPDLAVVAYR